MGSKIYYNPIAYLQTNPVASSTAPTYEAKYALDYNQKSLWAATGQSETYLLNFGGPVAIEAAYVGNSNLPGLPTTFELQAGTTSATTDFSIDLKGNITEMRGVLSQKSWADTFKQTYQYWKFVFSISTPFIVSAGKLELFEKSYEFPIGYVRDRSLGSEAAFIETKGLAYNDDRELLDIRAKRDLSFQFVEKSQFDIFDTVIRAQNKVCFYDAERNETYFGEIEFYNETGTRCNDNYNINARFTESR